MLRCIAEVKEDIQVMRCEFELGGSYVCHAHVLFTHVATHVGPSRGTATWDPTRPHAHLVSIVTGETEFNC
jgi:hypothetical protein